MVRRLKRSDEQHPLYREFAPGLIADVVAERRSEFRRGSAAPSNAPRRAPECLSDFSPRACTISLWLVC